MEPHLVRWNEKYVGRGLKVIQVFNGPADEPFEVGRPDVAAHVESHRLSFPVLFDANADFCDSFGVAGYPAACLVGRDGKVVWQGHPVGATAEENLIRKLLGLSPLESAIP